MSSAERIGWLMYRHTRNELSGKEKKELSAWRSLSAQNELFFQSATDPENLRARLVNTTEAESRIYHTLRQRFPDLPDHRDVPRTGKQPAKVFHLSPRSRFTAAAIAVVIALVVGARWYFFENGYSIAAGSYAASTVSPEGVTEDLSSPWGEMKRGYRDGQGHNKRKTMAGNIIYRVPDEPGSRKDRYYTLFTKKGEEYSLQLSDGTTIWLNAATSIKYPANMLQDTIHIAVDGEAYFELAGNASHVYLVSIPSPAGRHGLSVTGSSPSRDSLQITADHAYFNVMNYPDEPVRSVTLIKGKALVRLDSSTAPSSLLLVPGQQAKPDAGKLSVVQIADSSDIIAWKNNQTSFHDAGIQTIMRFVARWYNVEIIYQGKIPDKLFTVSLPRDAKISALLGVLEKQGARFVIHERTITVIF